VVSSLSYDQTNRGAVPSLNEIQEYNTNVEASKEVDSVYLGGLSYETANRGAVSLSKTTTPLLKQVKKLALSIWGPISYDTANRGAVSLSKTTTPLLKQVKKWPLSTWGPKL
jgi:hypothetical protein